MLRRDAHAGVLHGKGRAFFAVAPADGHLSSGRRVADGVAHQVAEGARQLGLRPEQVFCGCSHESNFVAAGGQRLGIGAQAVEERRDAHALLQRRRGGLQGGQREQVLDDVLHAPRLLAHHADVVAHALCIERQIAHRLQEADQHRERRAQLVRDIGDEIAPHRLDALGLRHVAREQKLVRAAVGDDQQHDGGVVALHARRRCVLARGQVVDEMRVADQVGDRLAEVAPGVDLQVRRRGAVAPLDAVGSVQDDDAVGQRLRGAAKACQRFG